MARPSPISSTTPSRSLRWNAGATLGPWRLVRQIDSGEWSEVFLATPLDASHSNAADYAIKVLAAGRESDPQARTLLQREAYFARSITHPHLVSVLSAHVDRPPYFLVMPYLRGVTLRSQMSDRQPMALAQALWIARQAAEGLAAIHENGWLHGDLKPENIHLSVNGHVTLCDLGFARELAECRGSQGGVWCGTPAYLPPEAFSCQLPLTLAVDIYALGITLAEMLTGVRPFEYAEADDLVIAHRQEIPWGEKSPTLGLPPAVVRLVRRMLAKEPLRRPTCGEIIDSLIDLEIDAFCHRGSYP